MSVNALIRKTLKSFGFEVVPDVYDGEDETYFTFNFPDERGAGFADNAPSHLITYVQIHLFIPEDESYLQLKKDVREALFTAGFTYPAVTVRTEKEVSAKSLAEKKKTEARHIIFECEIEEEREE